MSSPDDIREPPHGVSRGIALLCHADGTVADLLVDDVGVGTPAVLAEVFDGTSIPDGLSLLRDIEHRRLTAPWQLTVVDRHGTPAPMVFIGGDAIAKDEGPRRLLVLGADNAAHMRRLTEQVRSFTDAPGQAALTRLAATIAESGSATDEAAMNELSRMNNELIALQRELNGANAALQRYDRRRDQMLGMLAHDLRNPLGSIGTYATTLRYQLGDTLDERSKLLLERIAALSARMLDVVDDMLDVAAIRNDALQLDLDDTDVCHVLLDVAETYRPNAERKGISITLDGAVADRPHIRLAIDASRMQQVFENLVSNAIKYSPADAGATIRLACTDHGDRVVIEVVDEGLGIPPDEHDRVFEPFSTTSTTPTGGESSTGLGLAIALSVVRAHGGTLDFHPNNAGGTTFRVELPRHPTDAQTHDVATR